MRKVNTGMSVNCSEEYKTTLQNSVANIAFCWCYFYVGPKWVLFFFKFYAAKISSISGVNICWSISVRINVKVSIILSSTGAVQSVKNNLFRYSLWIQTICTSFLWANVASSNGIVWLNPVMTSSLIGKKKRSSFPWSSSRKVAAFLD